MWRGALFWQHVARLNRTTSKLSVRPLSVKREIASTRQQRRRESESNPQTSEPPDFSESRWRNSPESVQRLAEGLVRLDQSRWHGLRTLRIFVVAGLFGAVAVYSYGDDIRTYFAEEVAGVANRSMEDEELIRRAGVLATSVVADEAVRKQTTMLLKASVQALLADEELRKLMLGYLAELFRDASTKKAVADSLYDLVQQQNVQDYMSEFFVIALQSQSVTDQVNSVAKSATQEVLADEIVRLMASDALWDVVRGTVWKRPEKEKEKEKSTA